MNMTQELYDTVNAMQAQGGSFVATLAQAIVEADSGHYFAKELLEMRSKADGGNLARLKGAFPDVWAIHEMAEDERRGRLLDAFADIVDDYRPKSVATAQGA